MLRAVRVVGEVGSDGFEGGRPFLQAELGRTCEAYTEGIPWCYYTSGQLLDCDRKVERQLTKILREHYALSCCCTVTCFVRHKVSCTSIGAHTLTDRLLYNSVE